jgi:hypothetical protein
VAEQGGAIAYRWRSHWRRAGYDFRKDHKERDNEIYLIRNSWAKDQGLIKAGSAGYYDEITSAAQEPFCQCYVVAIYALRELPEDMLTEKGKKLLEETRLKRTANAA